MGKSFSEVVSASQVKVGNAVWIEVGEQDVKKKNGCPLTWYCGLMGNFSSWFDLEAHSFCLIFS